MKSMIMNEIKHKYVYAMLVLLFVLASTELKFPMKMFVLLGILYGFSQLFKDKKLVWHIFFTYPLSARKIVLSKMIVVFTYILIIAMILWFTVPYYQFQIASTLLVMHSLCFLSSNYLVADGYCGNQQVNVLEVLSNVFFFFCMYNHQEWFPVLHSLFGYIPYIIIVSLIFILIVAPTTMKKCNQKQIALSVVMGSIKMMHEITYASSLAPLRIKSVLKIENYSFEKTMIDRYFVISLYACKDVQYLLLIVMLMLLLQMKGLFLLSLFYVVYKWIHAFTHRRKALMIIGANKK